MERYWDAFISHASEDKDTIVRQLADNLGKLQVKIWYDEFSLKVGDSLSKSIDEGLLKSRFGIIVISKKFLEKRWPDYEYRSLLSKEENGKKIILPIWHGITKEAVKEFSLYLSDKVALDSSKMSINKLSLTLIEVIRPDIYQALKAHYLFKELLKNAETKKIRLGDLKKQEKPQSKLSKQLEIRVRIIFHGIGQALKYSIEDTIYNFELDFRPDIEIQIWERMNLCYLEFINKYKVENIDIKNSVAQLLIGFSIGKLIKPINLSEDKQVELSELWKRYYHDY
jgi:hypothetical protein